MTNQITYTGSLSSLAPQRAGGLAATFATTALIVLVDTSASMKQRDDDERTRYDLACQQLANLQAAQPGQVAVFSFSTSCYPCPGGHPVWQGKSTDVANALKTIRDLGTSKPLVLISDGKPNSAVEALAVAEELRSSRLDTIYVGPKNDYEAQGFLKRLAEACGGSYRSIDHVEALQDEITRLLPAGGAK